MYIIAMKSTARRRRKRRLYARTSYIQQDGGKVEAALEAHRTALGGHEVDFLLEVLHHPDHEPRHIPAKRDATLLEVLDESARKLDVKLLPNLTPP